jgi:phosphoserine phosphatase RsbU/P
MASELSIRSPRDVRVVALERDRYVLGRLRSSDLSFPDDGSLSKQHVVFERDGEGWAVTDLGSRNGTFLNGTRIAARQRLQPGDTIRAGQITATFGRLLDETVVFDAPGEHDTLPTAVRTNLEQALHRQQADDARGIDSMSPLAALMQAGRELAARRPASELFSTILDLAIDAAGAHRGVLLSKEDDRLVIRATRGDGFRISSTVRDAVLSEKTSLLVQDTALDPALRQQDSIVVQHVRTLMAVPLQTDEQVIGLLYLDSPSAYRLWTADDLDLMTVLGNIAALRLERERLQKADEVRRLLAAELRQAADMQRRFLPAAPPLVPGLDLAGYNVASRSVGGDYYDFLALPDGRQGCVLADVAGKGMPAALVMMNLQARVQVLSETQFEPAAFMTTLDHVMQKNCPDDRFITVFYCAVDPADGQLRYANAGHNPPVLVRADGSVEWLREGGPILGVLPHASFGASDARLMEGDTLVVYSDGLTEATGPQDAEFGDERLAETVVAHRAGSAQDVVTALQTRVAEWCGGTPQKDDLTVMVVKKTW